MYTDYHAKYFAHELTRRFPSDSGERLAGAVASAQVDLNPHQIDAALFAFRSPLSKGALLADEVGLGKTIEAGLVLSQKWAERKQRILVIVPSDLRTQWYQELTEKFFLPCRILESKSYNAAIKQGQFRPFEAAEIVICSYQVRSILRHPMRPSFPQRVSRCFGKSLSILPFTSLETAGSSFVIARRVSNVFLSVIS